MSVDDVPRVPWGEFVAGWRWNQGEHVALVGPTGRGKSVLAFALAEYRLNAGGSVCALGTKPDDATLRRELRRGWRRIDRWPPDAEQSAVVLWPRWRTPKDTPKQRAVIGHALYRMFGTGRWCVLVDDVQYLTQRLQLRGVLTDLWLQGRALKLTLVGATQRPVWAPREMFAESSHYFLWGCSDDADLKGLAGLGMADTRTVRRVVASLDDHDVLYVDGRRSNRLAITRAPNPGG